MARVFFNLSINCDFNNNLDKDTIYDLFQKRKEIINKDISPYTLIKEIGETFENENPMT